MQALQNLLEQIPLVTVFKTQVVAYAMLNASHILCIGMFMGTLLPLDLGTLRAPGFSWTTAVAGALRRMAVAAFLCTAFTGLLLLTVRPADYLGNGAFLTKVSLLILAGCNAALFHVVSGPGVRRILAGLSLAMWVSVLFAGRWIGFV